MDQIATFTGAEINDLSVVVTWTNVPDANITEGSVTQHEAALTILESQITDSTILARVAADETISGHYIFTGTGRNQSIDIEAAEPFLGFTSTAAIADEGFWHWRVAAGSLHLGLENDAQGAGNDWCTVQRTGITVDSIAFGAPITATAFGGITSANLLDKTDTETISGVYTYTNNNIHSGGSLRFNDNIMLHLGTGEDVDISFNATDFVMDSLAGVDFRFLHNGENRMVMIADLGIQMFWNGVEELTTMDHSASDRISGADVKDNSGTMRQVGFADMETVNIATSTTLSDNHVHKVLTWTGGGAGLDVTFADDATYPADSVGWIKNISGFSKDLVEGTGVTIRWLDGAGGVEGNHTLADRSVITWHKVTDTFFDIFGAGLG